MALFLLKVDKESCDASMLWFLVDSLPEKDAICSECFGEPERLTIGLPLEIGFLLFHADARVPCRVILGCLHERHARKGGMNACLVG